MGEVKSAAGAASSTSGDQGNVIEIGDFSFERQRRWSLKKQPCSHKRMTLEEEGEIIRCRDCGSQVGAWWALQEILSAYTEQMRSLRVEREQLARERKAVIHLTAARAVERVWRSRDMVPACPHCHAGIFATDGLGNIQINREIEERRRNIARSAEEPRDAATSSPSPSDGEG